MTLVENFVLECSFHFCLPFLYIDVCYYSQKACSKLLTEQVDLKYSTIITMGEMLQTLFMVVLLMFRVSLFAQILSFLLFIRLCR